MAITVKINDLDYARIEFERLLAHNCKSADKNQDGTYYYTEIQNWWVMYQSGFRVGRDSAGGTCEF